MKQELLEILTYPKCKGNLDFDEENNILICENFKLKFKIEENIPILLIDKAEKF